MVTLSVEKRLLELVEDFIRKADILLANGIIDLKTYIEITENKKKFLNKYKTAQ